MLFRFIIVLSCCFALHAQSAVDVIEFDNDKQREQYQKLSEELRCPKCPNQNLVGTDSSIAYDLRREVARLLKEGSTEAEIKTYMVNRYGDFVLYEPPVNRKTYILWWSPLFMLLAGLSIFGFVVFKRSKLINHHPKEVTANNTAMSAKEDSQD